VVASWVAVLTAFDGILTVAKASPSLIIGTGITALLGVITIAILTTAEQRAEQQSEEGEAEIPVLDLSSDDRWDLIDRVWSQRIVNGLGRSLQHAVEMQLNLRHAPSELLQPSFRQTTGRSGDHVDLVTAYRDAGRQLVILGAPGSGKTTQVLVLMRHLLDVARRDPSAPVPELFQLPSWAKDRKPLVEWLTEQLQRRHGFRRTVGRSLLVHRRIVPMLDGLDEVAREHRADCMAEITRFWTTHGGGPIILCSRLAEYQELSERLPFGGAVIVEAPGDEQRQRYLEAAGPLWDAVRASLIAGDNPALGELLATPLMLSVVVLAYRGRDPSPLCAIHDLHEEAARLWAGYVEQMHARDYDPVLPSATPYTKEQAVHWLTWLASDMRERDATELWVHECAGPPEFLQQVEVVSRLLRGLVIGLLFGLVFGLLAGDPVFGLVVALITAVVSSAIKVSQPTYQVRFNLRTVVSRLVRRLVTGVVGGLLGGLVVGLALGTYFALNDWLGVGFVESLVDGLVVGLNSGLSLGLFFGLVGGLVVGLIDASPDRSRLAVNSPSQVITDSARLGLISGLVGGLVCGLGGGLVAALVSELIHVLLGLVGLISALLNALLGGRLGNVLVSVPRGGLIFGLGGGPVLALVGGLVAGLAGGLDAALGHCVYRSLLWYKGWAPLQWPRFLDWACSHLYLHSTGAAYQWVHVELRDYLADRR
jgi:hypothetical protein